MLIGDVRPTTLDGVKSLASQLRKQQGIKHSVALNLAAEAANCTNFRNAQQKLSARGMTPAHHYVMLTIYWCDKDQRYRTGRETLKINLLNPILETCPKSALKDVRGFDDLRMVADDHFVCDTVAHSQIYARQRLCTAERSLRFMEHTGLLPSRDRRKTYPDGTFDTKLPNTDHATDWVDPISGQLVVIDEPYIGAPNDEERAAWANRTGWRVAKTVWPGMYNPYYCELYAVTDGRSGYDLDSLVAKINAMPAPLIEKDWDGDSSPSWDTFVSPMAKTALDLRRARCRGTIYPTESATTVPYSYNCGSTRRRPIGELGIEGHIEAGRMIKSVIWSKLRPWSVYRRMNSLRCTLEDWMSLEINRGQLEGPEFFDVYYHDADADGIYWEMAKSPAGIVAMLGDLKQRLQAAYPDCAPLRQQLRRIDMSVSIIGRMKLTAD